MNKFLVTVDNEIHQVVVAPAQAFSAWDSPETQDDPDNPGCGEAMAGGPAKAGLQVQIDGRPARVTIPEAGHGGQEIDWVIVDGRPYEIDFDQRLKWIDEPAGRHAIQVQTYGAFITRPLSRDKVVNAPIPGRVLRVLVDAGQPVEPGQPLVVLEAMKMENEIRALCPGTVQSIHVQPGQCVRRDEKLVEIA